MVSVQTIRPTIRTTLGSGMKLISEQEKAREMARAAKEEQARVGSPLEMKRHRKTAHVSANDKRDETIEDMRTHLQQQANMITRAQARPRRLVSGGGGVARARARARFIAFPCSHRSSSSRGTSRAGTGT